MSDLISRQAVLDGLASIAKAKAKSDPQKSLMGRSMFFVEQLPSAEKTGRWIDGKCDKCGNHAPYLAIAASTYFINYTNFCPNCGARMESEGNERNSD